MGVVEPDLEWMRREIHEIRDGQPQQGADHGLGVTARFDCESIGFELTSTRAVIHRDTKQERDRGVENREEDEHLKAFDTFVAKYEAKYPGAVKCLSKDRDVLLTFYDFPAEHWIHLRTTNPIESTFSTVRLRHRRTKGSGSRRACLAMVFKLVQIAQSSWRRLNGAGLIVKLLDGHKFVDGVIQTKQEKDAA